MEDWMQLLREGVTAAHTIDYVKRDLLSEGFEELELEEKWNLAPGGRYYLNLYDTNCVAFRIAGKIAENSSAKFRIAMAHSDYPCFQIKPHPEIACKNVTKLNVEIYGGMYQKSWLDRPLGIGGQLIVRGVDPLHPVSMLYRSKRAICIIPSLAIHMDRELNKKGAMDIAKELVPLMSLTSNANLLDYIADEAGICSDDIIDYDLYTYVMDQPTIVGTDSALIASPRLDNLSSVAALLNGIEKCDKMPDDTVDMMVVFDNEEVGSRTKQGADSELLSWIIQKIGMCFNETFDKCDTVKESFLLSVDVAHAAHPNYTEKTDVTNEATLGSGFSIKRSVGQKYGTTAQSAAVLKLICEQNQIPYTIAVNKSGIPGGSTLGPIVSAHLPYPCADIGMPILSMHSACELGAVSDYKSLQQFLLAFYQL